CLPLRHVAGDVDYFEPGFHRRCNADQLGRLHQGSAPRCFPFAGFATAPQSLPSVAARLPDQVITREWVTVLAVGKTSAAAALALLCFCAVPFDQHRSLAPPFGICRAIGVKRLVRAHPVDTGTSRQSPTDDFSYR